MCTCLAKVTPVAGTGVIGSADGGIDDATFHYPTAIAVSPNGMSLLVVEGKTA